VGKENVCVCVCVCEGALKFFQAVNSAMFVLDKIWP
jgi:hypothetical protein